MKEYEVIEQYYSATYKRHVNVGEIISLSNNCAKGLETVIPYVKQSLYQIY